MISRVEKPFVWHTTWLDILLLFSNQFAPDSQQIFLVLSCGWRERGQVKICVSREGIIEILFSSK